MKRTITLITTLLVLAVSATAQKLNYSAVVRNSANELVTNANVTVKVAISPNENGNPVVYMETHTVTTSPNGMVSLTIGDGTPVSGSLSEVSWSTAYVISEFYLPDGSHVSAIMPVSAVPYALYTENISSQGLLDVVQSMTPEQIAALRDSMGIPKPEPISCDTMVDADGNRYASVLIGTQCWTKSNLRVAVGTLGVSSPTSNTFSSTEPYYYVNPDKDAAVYGYLYNWPAAMQACPSGWHLPTNEEWIAMEQTLTTVDVSDTAIGYYGNSAGKLAGGDTTDWNVSNVASAPGNMYYADRNATGFSAVPGGYWWREVKNVGEDAFFWTSSEVETSHAWRRCINFESAKVHRYKPTKPNGMSVRCVKGNLPTPESESDSTSCGTMTDADGNTYQTVQIGTQCWTKTNLRTTHYRNGGAIAENQNASSGAASYYRPTANDAVAEHYPDSVYGMYYNGYAVEGDTLCPDGWHVPAKAEWELLTTYMGGQNDYVCGGNPDYIARALAGTHHYTDQTGSTVYAWKHEDKNCAVGSDRGGNNKSGFSAFPAGYWETTFENYGRTARFWTSTPDNNLAWVSSLTYSEEMVTFYTGNKGQAISVRCLRDEVGETVHPTVTTDTATGVTSVKATLHGSYTNPHNLTITSTGFEWKTVDEVDYHVANASGDTMSYELTGLLPDTQYTYRAFVATEDSTYYGEDVTFTTEPEPPFSCGTSQMIDADGNHYETVRIGTQCWTKTNMRTTKKADGTDLPDSIPTDVLSQVYYTNPYYSRPTADTWTGENNSLPFESYSEEVFGLYYNWPAANAICPKGWHLPSDSDWTVLIDYVSNAQVGADYLYRCDPAEPTWIARALATDAEYWDRGGVSSSFPCEPEYDLSANNATGFSAVPAGCGYLESGYHYDAAGRDAFFWSSTESEVSMFIPAYIVSTFARGYNLYSRWESLAAKDFARSYCYSVRCLRDDAGDTIVHPTVTTDTATGVTSVKATLHGSYTNPHNLTLTSSGFEWKTVDASNYNVANASGDTMSYELTGLLPDTQYTYRAFVATEDSTYYGEDVTFTTEPEPPFSCGTSQMIDADGNHYETVKIGSRCWTKTNLRTTKFRNGNAIPEDVDPEQSSSASFSRLSPEVVQDILEDIPTYSDLTFGFYYNWFAAADTGDSKLCPEGWHVSTQEDWITLKSYLGTYEYCGSDPAYIAKALADSLLWAPYGTDCSIGKNPENNNASGFSAVPAGYLSYGEQYPIYVEVLANFWMAKPCDDNHNPNYYALSRYYAELLLNESEYMPKSVLLSVRCVCDEEYQAFVLPTVTTDSVTSITPTSAKLYGTVTNPNNVAITEMGFEWKEGANSEYAPTIVSGTELTTTLGNLTPSTKYFFRAYVKYEGRTVYGIERSFTTPLVSATTDSVTDITLTSAKIYGTVQNPSNVTLQAKGFVWKKSHGVYEYDTVYYSGANEMTHTLTGLTPNTKYDYQVFVQYGNRTERGEIRSFTTPNHPEVSCGTMTDADGNHYQTVKVGSQCWAKTNLRTTKYRKGSPISTQIGTTTPAYYRLSNTDKTTDSIVKLATAPDSIFGFYYNGYAAVRDSLCPVGWHVPDTNDWKDFIGYLKARPEYWCDNDPSNLAKAVASRNFWYSVETPPITYTIHHDPVARPCSPQYQVPDYLNDASYFSAIPAGAWYDNLGGNIDTVTGLGGHEFDPGKDAHFWSSSTQLGSDSKGYLIRFGLVTYDAVTFVYDALKYGRSVRCLKDAEPEPDPELPFSCGTSRMFDADGHTYETVQIGTQCWTKTNLRSAKDRNGNAFINGNAAFFGGFDATNDSVVYIPTQETWNVNNSLVTYNNSIFGYFYNWKAANLVCPAGWHLPTDAEWTTLTDYVKMESAYACGVDADYIAKALADTTTAWKSFEDDPCAPGYAPSSNNATGFGAVPAGYYYNSSLHDFGNYANFWSSTEYNGPYVYTCSLYYDYDYVDNYSNGKNLGFSVRCLRDE